MMLQQSSSSNNNKQVQMYNIWSWLAANIEDLTKGNTYTIRSEVRNVLDKTEISHG